MQGRALFSVHCKSSYAFCSLLRHHYLLSCEQIVHVRLEMAQFHLSTRFSHALCGHFVTEQPSGVSKCNFCNENCEAEVIRTFHLKMTLADKSGKVFAWCTGHTATEFLQISPDEFYELPEVIPFNPK